MKFFTGWLLAAGMALATTAAQAQVPAPYEAGRAPYYSVSDIGDPYYAPPRYAPPAQYGVAPPVQYPGQYPGPRYGYGQRPMLLPPTEVYTVVRESGFSPLGIPQQRGLVYTISVIDRGGDDGRLIIDARTGRIIRFIPAHRMGDSFNDDLTMNYGPPGPLPPTTHVRGAPRPPKPVPHVASRTVPVPKANPLAAAAKPAAAPEPAAKPVVAAEPAAAAKPAPGEPVQQSAAAQPKSAEAQTPPAAVTTGAAQVKPAPQIAPTQDMPNVQGLE
jgi:hypothetical protein